MQKEDLDVIVGAILLELVIDNSFYLSEDEMTHCIQKLNPNIIPINHFENEKIIKHLNWSLLDVEKIRFVVNSNPDALDYIDKDSKSKLKFKNIRRALVIKPSIFYDFDFSYGVNIDDEDVYHLIVNCSSEFIDEFLDVTKKFSTKRKFEVLKSCGFSEKCMHYYNLNEFDSYYISEIAKNTNNEAELLPLNKINIKHWIELLGLKPHLLQYFNIEDLSKSDPFYTVSFVAIFPEYEHIVTNNLLKKLSILSWEKLIQTFPNKYETMIRGMDGHGLVNILIDGFDIESSLVDKSKINTKEWIRLLRHKRSYVKYFNTDSLESINDIVDFIQMFPEKSYVFPDNRKGEVTTLGWEKLMVSNKDYFFDLCDFHKLNESAWQNILRVHPELKVHKF